MFTRLIWNFRSQVIHQLSLPKCWDYRPGVFKSETVMPLSLFLFLKTVGYFIVSWDFIYFWGCYLNFLKYGMRNFKKHCIKSKHYIGHYEHLQNIISIFEQEHTDECVVFFLCICRFSVIFLFLFFGRARVLLFLPRLKCNELFRLTATSTSWVQAFFLPQPPE